MGQVRRTAWRWLGRAKKRASRMHRARLISALKKATANATI